MANYNCTETISILKATALVYYKTVHHILQETVNKKSSSARKIRNGEQINNPIICSVRLLCQSFSEHIHPQVYHHTFPRF